MCSYLARNELTLVSLSAFDWYGKVWRGGISSTLALEPDGHFERSSIGAGTINGSSASSMSKQSSARSGSVSSGVGTSYHGSSSQDGASKMTGRYRVKGYTMILQTDGGRVEHHRVFYPFDDDSDVFFDDKIYSLPDDD